MERNRKSGSKSSRNASINNSALIKAVKTLKANKVITEDKDLSRDLQYSKTMISEYLNNNRQVSKLFMIKFNEKYFPSKAVFNGSTKEIITLLKNNNTLLKNIETLLKKTHNSPPATVKRSK